MAPGHDLNQAMMRMNGGVRCSRQVVVLLTQHNANWLVNQWMYGYDEARQDGFGIAGHKRVNWVVMRMTGIV